MCEALMRWFLCLHAGCQGVLLRMESTVRTRVQIPIFTILLGSEVFSEVQYELSSFISKDLYLIPRRSFQDLVTERHTIHRFCAD